MFVTRFPKRISSATTHLSEVCEIHIGQDAFRSTDRPVSVVHDLTVSFFAGQGEFTRALRLCDIKLSDCDLMLGHESSIVVLATV